MSFGFVSSVLANYFDKVTCKDLGESFRCEADIEGETFRLEIRYDFSILEICHGQKSKIFRFESYANFARCLPSKDASFIENAFIQTRSFFYILISSLSFVRTLITKGFDAYIQKVCGKRVDVGYFLAEALASARGVQKSVVCEEISFYNDRLLHILQSWSDSEGQCSMNILGGPKPDLEVSPQKIYETAFLYASWAVDEPELCFADWCEKFSANPIAVRPYLLGEVSRLPLCAQMSRRLHLTLDNAKRRGVNLQEPLDYPYSIVSKKDDVELVFCFAASGFRVEIQEDGDSCKYIFS